MESFSVDDGDVSLRRLWIKFCPGFRRRTYARMRMHDSNTAPLPKKSIRLEMKKQGKPSSAALGVRSAHPQPPILRLLKPGSWRLTTTSPFSSSGTFLFLIACFTVDSSWFQGRSVRISVPRDLRDYVLRSPIRPIYGCHCFQPAVPARRPGFRRRGGDEKRLHRRL